MLGEKQNTAVTVSLTLGLTAVTFRQRYELRVFLAAEAEILCVNQFTHLQSAMCFKRGELRLPQSLLLTAACYHFSNKYRLKIRKMSKKSGACCYNKNPDVAISSVYLRCC
jgi:hypothetical protein